MLDDMIKRAQGALTSDDAGQALLSAAEAERAVAALAPLHAADVGGAAFLSQHEAVERLSLQARWNAARHSDEFVVELLVLHQKLPALVHSLLAAEAWLDRAYPLLRDHLAAAVDSAHAYAALYHEAALAALLEVVLFHVHAVEAAGEDALLELADWALRKLHYLNGDARADAARPAHSAKELLEQSPLDDVEDKRREVRLGAALCALGVLRQLCANLSPPGGGVTGATAAPLSLLARLAGGHDTVMALAPLLERPPWERTVTSTARNGGGAAQLERFADGRWRRVAPGERAALHALDAQVWLSLAHLLVPPAPRARYGARCPVGDDGIRRDALARLRRRLNDERLLDQLPALHQLARALDELMLGGGGGGTTDGNGGRLLMEQVVTMRDAVLRAAVGGGGSWRALADAQRAGHFGAASTAALARARVDSMAGALDFMCRLEEAAAGGGGDSSIKGVASSTATNGSGTEDAGAAAGRVQEGAAERVVRVTCSRRVAAGVWEPWCELAFEVDASAPLERVSVAAAPSAEGDAAAATATVITGVRRRLRLLPSGGKEGSGVTDGGIVGDATRALPTNGRAVVRYGGRRAEALLQLPAPPTKHSLDEAPPGLWVTVGLLAADGVALQLRLKRTAEPKERDRAEGVWHVYHAVGGAVTLRGDDGEEEGNAGGGGE